MALTHADLAKLLPFFDCCDPENPALKAEFGHVLSQFPSRGIGTEIGPPGEGAIHALAQFCLKNYAALNYLYDSKLRMSLSTLLHVFIADGDLAIASKSYETQHLHENSKLPDTDDIGLALSRRSDPFFDALADFVPVDAASNMIPFKNLCRAFSSAIPSAQQHMLHSLWKMDLLTLESFSTDLLPFEPETADFCEGVDLVLRQFLQAVPGVLAADPDMTRWLAVFEEEAPPDCLVTESKLRKIPSWLKAQWLPLSLDFHSGEFKLAVRAAVEVSKIQIAGQGDLDRTCVVANVISGLIKGERGSTELEAFLLEVQERFDAISVDPRAALLFLPDDGSETDPDAASESSVSVGSP